jgi:hypothetical protein
MAKYAKKVEVQPEPVVDLAYIMYNKECIAKKQNVPAYVGIGG